MGVLWVVRIQAGERSARPDRERLLERDDAGFDREWPSAVVNQELSSAQLDQESASSVKLG